MSCRCTAHTPAKQQPFRQKPALPFSPEINVPWWIKNPAEEFRPRLPPASSLLCGYRITPVGPGGNELLAWRGNGRTGQTPKKITLEKITMTM
ncbi:hypothetical protein GUJ93_ZPchr0010g10654 [Zizania palustris]|uniref:Uncharacterized protein n=1 Tax=Zizania palustris TaxID=103762 RepID=A0A8J5SZ64_ZIZPA|nr:hypothetical protein GUJ93_ZPchr0010g10654 [Zizania palustris]